MNKLLYTSTTIIRERLLESEALRAMVGENIFPLVANDHTDGDIIIVQRNVYERERSKMGGGVDSVEILVSAISSDYDRSVELAELIDRALDNDEYLRGRGVALIELLGANEAYDDYKYIQELIFQLQY